MESPEDDQRSTSFFRAAQRNNKNDVTSSSRHSSSHDVLLFCGFFSFQQFEHKTTINIIRVAPHALRRECYERLFSFTFFLTIFPSPLPVSCVQPPLAEHPLQSSFRSHSSRHQRVTPRPTTLVTARQHHPSLPNTLERIQNQPTRE